MTAAAQSYFSMNEPARCSSHQREGCLAETNGTTPFLSISQTNRSFDFGSGESGDRNSFRLAFTQDDGGVFLEEGFIPSVQLTLHFRMTSSEDDDFGKFASPQEDKSQATQL